jgi:hypothetical protein
MVIPHQTKHEIFKAFKAYTQYTRVYLFETLLLANTWLLMR